MPKTDALSVADEVQLLEQLRSGSEPVRARAFERLFEHLRRPIFRLCLHTLGTRAEAEEAMQETFAAVFRGLPAFRADSRLLTWVYAIAARTSLRLKARETRHAELQLEQGPTFAPSEDLEHLRVLEALRQLPADQSLVLSLFAAEGLSQADIAAVLEIPVGTVWLSGEVDGPPSRR